jgi:hypothetical protein
VAHLKFYCLCQLEKFKPNNDTFRLSHQRVIVTIIFQKRARAIALQLPIKVGVTVY